MICKMICENWGRFATALFSIGLAASAPFPALAGASGTWAVTGTMNTGRSAHSATLLQNGQVLITGGINAVDQTLSSAELYNPATGKWTFTGSMAMARYDHTAVLLPSGAVLVAGGIISTSSGVVTAEAEVYNPSTGQWTTTGSMETPRFGHGAALLQDGQVLVAGGNGPSSCCSTYASAELYNPATGTWTFTGSMNYPRATQAALLRNGKVLMAGGGTTEGGQSSTAELYSNGSWTLTSPMVFSHPSSNSVALANGNGLVYGGNLASYVAEFYSPSTGLWTATHNLGLNPPGGVTLTFLHTGNALLAGGAIHETEGFVAQSYAHLYNPSDNDWLGTGSMHQARSSHSATLLQNGQVLAAGGGSTVLGSAELYTP